MIQVMMNDLLQNMTKANIRALKTWLLLLMLTLGFGETWADDYKFIIINNKGNQAFNYTISTTTTQVHAKAKSVLATNFRFYTTEAAAQTGMPS